MGGFTLKGIKFSGSEPPEHLTDTGDSVVVGSPKWYPKGDFISINCAEKNLPNVTVVESQVIRGG